MPFPQVTATVTAEVASIQGVKLIVTVNGLSDLAPKVVALSFQFTEVANNRYAYFAKFVPANATSTTFTITVPYPDNADPENIPLSDIIVENSLVAEYYFVDGNPAPLNA